MFYSFSLERHVPADHLLRSIYRFVDLSDVRAHLRPLLQRDRPSFDRPGTDDPDADHRLLHGDTFSRCSPVVVPRFGFRAPDVIEVLEQVCSEIGYPGSIRVDQGSEFISRDEAKMRGLAQRLQRGSAT